MTKRVDLGGGRPSKGLRRQLATRVSVELAEAVRAEAERLDLSYSDVMANIIAAHYGHAPVAVPQSENQMKLTA